MKETSRMFNAVRSMFPQKTVHFPNVEVAEPSPISALTQDESKDVNFAMIPVVEAVVSAREQEVLGLDPLENQPTISLSQLLPTASREKKDDALVNPKIKFTEIFTVPSPEVHTERRFSINIADERLVKHVNDRTSLEFDYSNHTILWKDSDPQHGVKREIGLTSTNSLPIKEQSGNSQELRRFSYEVTDMNAIGKMFLNTEKGQFYAKASREVKGNIGVHMESSFNPSNGSLVDVSVTVVPPGVHKDKKLPGSLEDKYFAFTERPIMTNMKELSEIVTQEGGIEVLIPDASSLEMGLAPSDALEIYIEQIEEWVKDSYPEWTDDQRKQALNDVKIACGNIVKKYFPSLEHKLVQRGQLVAVLALQAFMHLPETYFQLDYGAQKTVLLPHINESVAETLASYYTREQRRSSKTTILHFSNFEASDMSLVATIGKTEEKSSLSINFGKEVIINGVRVLVDQDGNGNLFFQIRNVGEDGSMDILIPRTVSPQAFMQAAEGTEYYKALYLGPQMDNSLAEKEEEPVIRKETQVERKGRGKIFANSDAMQWDNERHVFQAAGTDPGAGLTVQETIGLEVTGGVVNFKSERKYHDERSGLVWQTVEQTREAPIIKIIEEKRENASHKIELVYGSQRRDCTADVEYSSSAIGDGFTLRALYRGDALHYDTVPLEFRVIPEEAKQGELPLSLDGKIDYFAGKSLDEVTEAIQRIYRDNPFSLGEGRRGLLEFEAAVYSSFPRLSDEKRGLFRANALMSALERIQQMFPSIQLGTEEVMHLEVALSFEIARELPISALETSHETMQQLLQQATDVALIRLLAKYYHLQQEELSSGGTLFFNKTKGLTFTPLGDDFRSRPTIVVPGQDYTFKRAAFCVRTGEHEGELLARIPTREGVRATFLTEMDGKKFEEIRAIAERKSDRRIQFPVSVRER